MATEKTLILIIILMMIVTIIPRIMPLFIKLNTWPQWFKDSLEFLPVAIVASLVIPNIIATSYEYNFYDVEFFTTIITILAAIFTRNLMITIIIALSFHYLFTYLL